MSVNSNDLKVQKENVSTTNANTKGRTGFYFQYDSKTLQDNKALQEKQITSNATPSSTTKLNEKAKGNTAEVDNALLEAFRGCIKQKNAPLAFELLKKGAKVTPSDMKGFFWTCIFYREESTFINAFDSFKNFLGDNLTEHFLQFAREQECDHIILLLETYLSAKENREDQSNQCLQPKLRTSTHS